MEIIWACFMQMTNLVHAAAHLELLTNSLTEERGKNKFMCVRSCCELGGKFS